MMLAQIPTTAVINKAAAEAKATVAYDGPPQFKSIFENTASENTAENSAMKYAVNTQNKVIKDGDLYYLCWQAVWFTSTTPSGPWKAADSVPREIYSIPPSSPVYNVTHVTQTSVSTNAVESSATAGYLGMFVAGGAVVFGTGYFYPPHVYWGPGMAYPAYHAWPTTYGDGVVYNRWTARFESGGMAYGPYGATDQAAWYNPATDRYERMPGSQGRSPYSQWGTSATVAFRGAKGSVVRVSNGNVYAGSDGNVYRRDPSGSWSQYADGGWTQSKASPGTMQELQGSWQSRQRGTSRMQQFNHFARTEDSARRSIR
jgi:hypothetical protein